MRQIYWKNKYEFRIKVLDEKKLILWMDCECQDFIQRKIKKIGEFSEIKYIAQDTNHFKNYGLIVLI